MSDREMSRPVTREGGADQASNGRSAGQAGAQRDEQRSADR
jgi:hypothetical protein